MIVGGGGSARVISRRNGLPTPHKPPQHANTQTIQTNVVFKRHNNAHQSIKNVLEYTVQYKRHHHHAILNTALRVNTRTATAVITLFNAVSQRC